MCTHAISVQSIAADTDFPVCNLIDLSCQYECMTLACVESGYLSTCVSMLSAHILCVCVCVHAGVALTSAWLQSLHLTVDIFVCVVGIFGQRNSICLRRLLSTLAAPHITHLTADTLMSPRQPDTAEDTLLTEKHRPLYWWLREHRKQWFF